MFGRDNGAGRIKKKADGRRDSIPSASLILQSEGFSTLFFDAIILIILSGWMRGRNRRSVGFIF
jgi:hypothetical protein